MEAVIKCDKRDGNGDGYCYRIETLMHVVNVMALMMEVLDIVRRSNL